ncbi:MAG: CRISPR-associated protein Cas4 [Capsulimonadaceae bacterium]|nr:CRISPR-associated protein Cas4 [Capsulimonadaceae bacterium]
MFPDHEYVPISALEHYSYCPRQCALIHAERVYDENVFTLRGNRMHERADERSTRIENGVRVERALPLWSDALGLAGVADIVEFHDDGAVLPVEYKPGSRPVALHDDIQLCAQAMCLEEMLGIHVAEGALFSGERKRRRTVEFSRDLRDLTRELIEEVRAMMKNGGALPPAVSDARCENCSLREACMPETVVAARRVPRGRIYRPAVEGDVGGVE